MDVHRGSFETVRQTAASCMKQIGIDGLDWGGTTESGEGSCAKHLHTGEEGRHSLGFWNVPCPFDSAESRAPLN